MRLSINAAGPPAFAKGFGLVSPKSLSTSTDGGGHPHGLSLRRQAAAGQLTALCEPGPSGGR